MTKVNIISYDDDERRVKTRTVMIQGYDDYNDIKAQV